MSFLAVYWQDVLVQLINFAIFFAILNVIFLRPVSAAIRRRRAYINSVAADIEQSVGLLRRRL